jgi:uncharacterized SAM-binding protein YcdF (DUF218 family)
MKRETGPDTREAMGCFLMLIFGAILVVCVIRFGLFAISPTQRAGQSDWWQSTVLWVLVAGAGVGIVAWLTYGLKGLRSDERVSKDGRIGGRRRVR